MDDQQQDGYMRLYRYFTAACAAVLFSMPLAARPDTGARLDEADWRDRFHEKAAQLRAGATEVVFLGDSIFHSFEWVSPDPVWDHWYRSRHAVNLGFNGDRVSNVIWRVQHGELDGISPRLAVILIGTNDLGHPVDTIVSEMETLVNTVRQRAPGTRILLLGILPSGKPAVERRDAQAVNTALESRFAGADPFITYLDVSCVFLRRGQLNSALFREASVPGSSEPLHPTPHGMDLLASRIEPVVAATLGDKPRSTPGFLEQTDCRTDG